MKKKKKKKKKKLIGSDFPAIFQAFLPLERILLLMVHVRKVVANGVVFLTFGAIAFGAI